jgi:hypothetical protein
MLLNKKISDSRFLGLIHKLLVAPTIDSNGMTRRNECGVPQGSILSPVLSNIYLHHVVDEWVEELKAFFRYGLSVIRYADDMVFVFQNENDGVRFFETLPKRLAKYGLEMAVEKSSVVPTGRFTISRLIESGNGMPKFNFLGFEVFWTKTRAGKHYRGRVRPRPDRMNKRLKEIKEFLRKSRATQDHMSIIQKVKRVVDGWMRYFAVTDCGADVHNFSSKVRRMLFRWFNRRGCNNAVRWDKMQKILDSINYNQVIPIYSLISNSSTKS